MLWIFVIGLVLVCIGVLWAGMRRAQKVADDVVAPDAARAFFRTQLEGIDRDVDSGRMSPDEAEAARAELAREVIRHDKEAAVARPGRSGRLVLMGMLPVVAVASVALYAMIGRADLPAQPLAEREIAAPEAQISIEDAVARVEAQMVETPNDVRGWLVLAPIYMEQQRFGEAVSAWRRVLDLEAPTPDRQTSLAEALVMANGGQPTEESTALLVAAADADPTHVRSRFYLAGQMTEAEDYENAVAMWQELLAIGTGEEAWIATARQGLVAAQAGLEGTTLGDSEPDATMDVMIRGMVDGMAARLYQDGGSADEWMQLVRSRQQLDGDAAALEDVERGLAALEGRDRLALQTYAQDLGLNSEQ